MNLLNQVRRAYWVSAGFGVSLLLVGGGILWSYFELSKVDQPLILHWNSLVGINQIGTLGDLLRVGFLGLVVVLVNFRIALALEERDWFWGKFATVLTLAFSILLFIGLAAIISVN